VRSVSNTEIFARFAAPRRQLLVYSMKLSAAEDLAMILPIPTPARSPDKAVRFISLKDYPRFFNDMDNGFPKPPTAPATRSFGKPRLDASPRPKLEVVNVGNFEASFVPTISDFDRLDARFKLPASTWEKLPTYARYGFAVFKLKKGAGHIHPMAFEFPTAQPNSLFFPTVHIHDGKVHDRAGFDHTLYCQRHNAMNSLMQWMESPRTASSFMNIQKTAGIVLANDHVYRRRLLGLMKNIDILV